MEARKGMEEMKGELMSRAEALGILARMATGRARTLGEVRALQMGVRALAKRLFDAERCYKRKRERAGTVLPPTQEAPGTPNAGAALQAGSVAAGETACLEEPWMDGGAEA